MYFGQNTGGLGRGCKYWDCLLIIEGMVQSIGGILREVGSLFCGSVVAYGRGIEQLGHP